MTSMQEDTFTISARVISYIFAASKEKSYNISLCIFCLINLTEALTAQSIIHLSPTKNDNLSSSSVKGTKWTLET